MLMGMCACSGGIPYNMMYYIIISALTRLEKLIIISILSKSKRFFPKIYSVVVKLVLFQLIYRVQPWTKSGNVTAFNVFITGELTISRFHLHQIRVCHELPQVQAPVIMALKSLNYKHMLYLSGNGLLVKCNWYKRKLWFSLLYF